MTFAGDTAVEPQGEGGGAWSAAVAEGWDIGGNANGGYLLAIAARAVLAATGRPDPITITAHYLSPGKVGPLTVPVRPVREGRRFSTAGVTLIGQDRPVIEALMTAGDLSAPEGPDFELYDGEPPDLPDPDDCPRHEPAVMASGFASRVETRCHPDDLGFLIGERSNQALIRGWFRLRDDEPMDTVALLLAADAFPPTVFNLDIPVNWVPTVELTVHVRARPAPGWLRCRFSTRYISDGFMEEDAELWDSNNRLVALSRQLALMPKG